MRSEESVSIGVDLIELKKVKVFYHEHRSRLGTFLNAYELRRLKRSPHPVRTLAEIFAAKEALYKADARLPIGQGRFLGRGFENVHLTPALSRRISVIRKGRFVVAAVKNCAGKS